MNEIQLKNKFIEFLELNPSNNFFGEQGELGRKYFEIKNEALNKKFDFILAVVKMNKINSREIKTESIEFNNDLKNIFTRNLLLKKISKDYKIKIQNLIIYPIEIKSDKDKLDDRLANQVIEAILSFGRSMVILDNKHSLKIMKNGLQKILPSTLIGYLPKEDQFKIINEYHRVFSDSLLNINKTDLIRTLEKSNCKINYGKLYRNLRSMQLINQKLVYNQIFNNDNFLLDEELTFIEKLSLIDQKISIKKEILKTIKQYKDYKITDFTD